jgi:multiple sugar transport system substrate-binding protein
MTTGCISRPARLSRVMLALVILLGLSCGLAQSAIEDHPPEVQQWLEMVNETSGGTTIRVSMGTHPSTEAFRAMEAEFEDLTGIDVEWDMISEPNLRPKHFALATSGASEFDVWMVDGFYIQEYVAKDTLVPLERFLSDASLTPSWFDYEDILPAYRQAIAQVDGEPYAVPTAGESRFIAYRTDLFEEHGIEPPTTTDELLAAAQYFADEVPDVFGLVSRAQRGIFYASGWLHVLYQFSDGWIDQETGEVIADSPGVVESLEYWNDLLRTGPPDIASYTHEEAASAFNTGDAALWFDATAIAGWLLDPERSDHTDSVGFLPPPEGPSGRYGGLAGWNLAIPKVSNNPEAGWAFVVWMTSRYNAVDYVDNGGVLVRQSLLENPDVTGEHPDMYEALQATFDAAARLTERGMVWIPPTWLANPVLQVAGEWGNRALLGDVTADEAATNIAEEIRAMQVSWE